MISTLRMMKKDSISDEITTKIKDFRSTIEQVSRPPQLYLLFGKKTANWLSIPLDGDR